MTGTGVETLTNVGEPKWPLCGKLERTSECVALFCDNDTLR